MIETPKPKSLYLRLLRYKDVKKQVEEFTEWEHKNQIPLLKSWHSYIKNVKIITYQEYCEQFYNGTLDDVNKKSYFKKLK